MMYRRNRRSATSNLVLILLAGIIAGVGFFVVDTLRSRREIAITPTPAPITMPPEAAAQPVGVLPTPTPVPRATLFIPKVGLSAPIITAYLDGVSWDVSQLGPNVGHLQGTTEPGQVGNVVLAGHVTLRDGTNGIFATIKTMSIGDQVYVIQGDQEWRYSVVSNRIVQPNDLSVVYPSIDERLTLITCESYDFFTDSYLERVVVVAERIQ